MLLNVSGVVLALLVASANAVTVYLAGDSTMALGGGGVEGQQGWGAYLQPSLKVKVVNAAIKSRSARSFKLQGHFAAIAAKVVKGDFVIIEFGHNDGGSLKPVDNGKPDCPGAGNETCKSTYGGQNLTLLTFPTYITNAVNSFKAKGASVILTSPTPINPWATGSFSYTPLIYATYSKAVAKATRSLYIDHGQYTANEFRSLGARTVNSYFVNQTIHTSHAGARTVAQAAKHLAVSEQEALVDHVHIPLAEDVHNYAKAINGPLGLLMQAGLYSSAKGDISRSHYILIQLVWNPERRRLLDRFRYRVSTVLSTTEGPHKSMFNPEFIEQTRQTRLASPTTLNGFVVFTILHEGKPLKDLKTRWDYLKYIMEYNRFDPMPPFLDRQCVRHFRQDVTDPRSGFGIEWLKLSHTRMGVPWAVHEGQSHALEAADRTARGREANWEKVLTERVEFWGMNDELAAAFRAAFWQEYRTVLPEVKQEYKRSRNAKKKAQKGRQANGVAVDPTAMD